MLFPENLFTRFSGLFLFHGENFAFSVEYFLIISYNKNVYA
jgi:hypothetical protein